MNGVPDTYNIRVHGECDDATIQPTKNNQKPKRRLMLPVTYLRDVHEAWAAVVEAEEGTVAHDVLNLRGDELGGVL